MPRQGWPPSNPARFWKRVTKNSGPSGDCWEWQGYRTPFGYGVTNWDGRKILAHRLSWFLAHGPIPQGLQVCHHCDNPPCVRTEHLFLGTPKENVAQIYAKGRQRTSWPVGEQLASAKIRASDVRAMRASGEAPRVLAQRYGIDYSEVCKILRRKAWRHVE